MFGNTKRANNCLKVTEPDDSRADSDVPLFDMHTIVVATANFSVDNKLGQGGFAKVFKVKRKSDGFICALKFVEPKNEKERKIILNEIGLMQMCMENQGILKVLEAYDFKQRLWIFVELMDDALTSFV